MSTWNCIYCTLINDPFYTLCQGCGSQKPLMEVKKPMKSMGSMVPKIITDTVRDVSNAISDLVTVKERRPAHNFVRVSEFRSPLPNGPYVDGQSNDPRANQHPSTSTFFVETPQIERPNRYENIDDNSESHQLSMCSQITEDLKRKAQKKSDVIYDDIIKYCSSSDSPFIDDQFLHNKKSIGVLHFTKNGVKRHEEPDFLNWLRPSQMFTKDGRSCPWSVFNSPRPSDIEQGTLVGDCWLMSAMALIAERPDVLDEIIPRKQYSHYGVYQIRLCVEGEWKVLIVDDFFPCYRQTNHIAMAVGRRNQLWVPLIEKAMAKELGSYSKLHGASLTQGLSMLTGAACVNYNCPPIPRTSDDVDTFWAQLVSSKESGFLMCCHCGAFENSVAEAEFRAMGLLTNHAYSILDVVYEHGHRLLRIRNPWGQFVWNGKWSDGWPGWPAEMKQRLLNRRRDETGAFWMDLNDFVTRFASVTVCKLRSDWSELRVTQKIGEKLDKALEIVVTETCEVSVTAFQKGAFNQKDNLPCLAAFPIYLAYSNTKFDGVFMPYCSVYKPGHPDIANINSGIAIISQLIARVIFGYLFYKNKNFRIKLQNSSLSTRFQLEQNKNSTQCLKIYANISTIFLIVQIVSFSYLLSVSPSMPREYYLALMELNCQFPAYGIVTVCLVTHKLSSVRNQIHTSLNSQVKLEGKETYFDILNQQIGVLKAKY